MPISAKDPSGGGCMLLISVFLLAALQQVLPSVRQPSLPKNQPLGHLSRWVGGKGDGVGRNHGRWRALMDAMDFEDCVLGVASEPRDGRLGSVAGVTRERCGRVVPRLRLRGGFERKMAVTYEGVLSKLVVAGEGEGTTATWAPVKLVLSDDLLRVYQVVQNGNTTEAAELDKDLGVVQLEHADYLPANRVQPNLLPPGFNDRNSSMLEIRVNGTCTLLASDSVEKRNKWLLALYQNRAMKGSRLLLQGKKKDGDEGSEGHPASNVESLSSTARRGWNTIASTLDAAVVRLISCSMGICFNPRQPVSGVNVSGAGGGEVSGSMASVVEETGSKAMSVQPADAGSAANQSAVSRQGSRVYSPEPGKEVGEGGASQEGGAGAGWGVPVVGEAAAATPRATSPRWERGRSVPNLAAEVTLDDASRRLAERSLGDQPLETVVVQAAEEHTATVIWLHSIGDTGGFFLQLPESLGVPWCRFVFPTARERPVTLHRGIEQPAWFDILSIDSERAVVAQDEMGLIESTRRVLDLVDAEIKLGIKPERIVLAGFGQGGAVALSAALECPHRLAGVVALSAWLQETPNFLPPPTTVGLPALICHGNADVFIPSKLARQTKDYLNSVGMHAAFKTYDMMGHAFCPKELVDVHKFMLQVVPRNDSMPELPSWMEAVVTQDSAGMMGMRKRTTRSLVLSEGSLQCFTIGQGELLQSYDVLDFVAHAKDNGHGESCIAVTQRSVLDPTDEGGKQLAAFRFQTERERDGWLVAIARWQQALISRSHQTQGQFMTRKSSTRIDGKVAPASSLLGRLLGGIGRFLLGSSSPELEVLSRASRSSGPRWENLVFSGGGIKSMVHPAALGVIADAFGDDGRELRWVKRVAGVSAGSICAVLIACGINVQQIQESGASLRFDKLTEGMSTIQGVRNMFSSYGAVDGTPLAEIVDDLIYKWTGLKYATFQDLYEYSGILLKVFATSVRNGALIEFSVEKTPQDQVAMACRSSMAVPFLFQAVPTSDGDLLVDGGVLDNCPLGCFDEVPGVRSPKTLGFWISAVDDGQPTATTSLPAFAMRMVELILYVEQFRALDREKHSEVVWIQAPDIALSTFEISDEDNRQLYECGAAGAARFLRPYKVWEAKTGHWPTPSALAKELQEAAFSSTSERLHVGNSRKPTSAIVMRWLAGESGGAKYDKIKTFVKTWLTERRRMTSIIRDNLGPRVVYQRVPWSNPKPQFAHTVEKCTSAELRALSTEIESPPG